MNSYFTSYTAGGCEGVWLRAAHRLGGCGPRPEARGSGREELPHVQGKEQRLHFAGAAVRFPTFKVRETQVRW